MAKTVNALSNDDKAFFDFLASVIFSNPFSFDREKLNHQRFGAIPDIDENNHHYTALIPELETRLKALEDKNVNTIHAVAATDRTMLEHAYLFQLYDRYVDQFDAHIQHQLRIGAEPTRVSLAEPLLSELKARGFASDQAQRYVALFFQLRRAYYFIARGLVGDSPSMRQLRHALWNAVFTHDVRVYAEHLWDRMEDFSTMILGETGTGKGSAAAAIGHSGLIPFDVKAGRFAHSFTETYTATNLSQFSENLIESELFGHRKGAFTGAVDNHQGLFERCSPHGALFLDEIGDVSVRIQIKLLSVLQDRMFLPVGSHKPLRFAGRIIAATNRPLTAMRHRGEFRDDFYYRLCTQVIEVPPLRIRLQEDPTELDQLVQLLVRRLVGSQAEDLTEHVLTRLKQSVPKHYAWPGNVRELEQAVRRVLLDNEYQPQRSDGQSNAPWLTQAAQGQLTGDDLLSKYCQMLYEQLGSYESVARRVGIDRRTVRRYIAKDTVEVRSDDS